jgi:acylphosphatase
VTGWVRNRWDDTVEVVAEGERPVLDQLLAALQQGPRASKVIEVRQDWSAASGKFTDFRIHPNG